MIFSAQPKKIGRFLAFNENSRVGPASVGVHPHFPSLAPLIRAVMEVVVL